jgi:hypothetical protein
MAGRKTYKTMQGKTVDMDMLRQRHELTPAVGNAKVNARGDQLGPGGEIVRKREEMVKEYYNNKPVPDEVPVSKSNQKKDLVDDWEDPEPTGGWVEDEDGNFVKKEDE